ncbi:MAG TPA: tetratricopeptide repeat protein [Bryobacteraceae bacterium]|nr:tetratricopeptide repeat protein [Bryobacteraceae bacterium]
MKWLAGAYAAGTLFAQSQTPEQSKPQYFDEPNFIVAGVADPTARGGHGSDPVSHSADVLAKAAAALRTGAEAPGDESALRDAIAREPNRADLHHALAALEEKQGHALEAVRDYQRAAELEPSEANLFDWGSELLDHRAADQAVEVFTRAARLFPGSTRMLLGLAVALYSRGDYELAGTRFFEATDVKPSDQEPYLFLGRVSSSAITESPGFAERMERFARLHPENAWANYYHGVQLFKQGHEERSQALLEKAVQLDPHLGIAFLQLGAMFADRGDLAQAIGAYRSAVAASPSLAEAHYRLSQVYRKTGAAGDAQKEIEIYRQLQQDSTAAAERERAEVQRFVFELRSH